MVIQSHFARPEGLESAGSLGRGGVGGSLTTEDLVGGRTPGVQVPLRAVEIVGHLAERLAVASTLLCSHTSFLHE